MYCVPHCFRLAAIASLPLLTLRVGMAQSPDNVSIKASTIILKQVLAPATPCRTFQRPIQFFSEESLLVLSGPSSDCYRSVTQVALNLISLDGHLIARKPWPSTDPGVVIDPNRLVLAHPAALEVDGPNLSAIQSVDLPPHRFYPSIQSIDLQNAVTVSMDGRSYTFAGSPLVLEEPTEHGVGSTGRKVFTFTDGKAIVQDGESLKLVNEGQPVREIASLEWVIPSCGRYTNCQAYDAGTSIQVSTGHKRRILVCSNGSKFPVTDAAGLFPYFRLQVFDFESGAELYREEDITRTGYRSAAISPDGDRLATTDGQKIMVHKLP